ncbi:hypothetical protein EXIGLDRAFT_762063 [Exidia glandulosa HHB12029]|uniref:Uncharacterized protein n=1 Tax=Exidia glandulosa HHB12029 TaxID=1314781 RepID=A0A165MYW9_EXIGL|nr:hypothetical protein EXIGLDRAFT_762063 [Exidia glandulosa HHB12029]
MSAHVASSPAPLDSMDWIPLPKPAKKMRPRLYRPAPLYFSHKRVSTLMTLARADVQEAEQGFMPDEAPTHFFHRLNRALIDAAYKKRGSSMSYAMSQPTCAHEDRAPAAAARVSSAPFATVLSSRVGQVDRHICASVLIFAFVISTDTVHDSATLFVLWSILIGTLSLGWVQAVLDRVA